MPDGRAPHLGEAMAATAIAVSTVIIVALVASIGRGTGLRDEGPADLGTTCEGQRDGAARDGRATQPPHGSDQPSARKAGRPPGAPANCQPGLSIPHPRAGSRSGTE